MSTDSSPSSRLGTRGSRSPSRPPVARARSSDGHRKILARSVEVNLTAHCNLACYGCDHASPVHPEEYLSVEEFAKDLAALAPVYHVFEFLLTGGEPLLHPDLTDNEVDRVIDAVLAVV